jgi:hypothetical protein
MAMDHPNAAALQIIGRATAAPRCSRWQERFYSFCRQLEVSLVFEGVYYFVQGLPTPRFISSFNIEGFAGFAARAVAFAVIARPLKIFIAAVAIVLHENALSAHIMFLHF